VLSAGVMLGCSEVLNGWVVLSGRSVLSGNVVHLSVGFGVLTARVLSE
jgi:hypothetical protein